jgi:hypothetical protein
MFRNVGVTLRHPARVCVLIVPLGILSAACGAPGAGAAGASDPSASVAPMDAGGGVSPPPRVATATATQASAPPLPPPAPPPPDHPFAATASEATALIDAAVDSRSSSVTPCIMAARAHRKNPHDKIQVEIGIDEQGHLFGVKAPRGAPSDPDLFACVQGALTGANFPKSHAGIITVTKTFEDQAVYR